MEKISTEKIPKPEIGLRQSGPEDQRFLFDLVRTSMKPVYEASGQIVSNDDEAFLEFQNEINPDAIMVVTYGGEAVGRLNVTHSRESIIVDGIHILPEYQDKGIGTSLLNDLITESKNTSKPIILEVREHNEKAFGIYKRLGFVIDEKHVKENGIEYSVMKYDPE